MKDLKIRFIPQAEIAPELQSEIDALDRAAFAGEGGDEDPEFSGIQ